MTRHQRLQRTMRSPVRAAKRAKADRRQDKYPLGRPAVHQYSRQPESALTGLFARGSIR